MSLPPSRNGSIPRRSSLYPPEIARSDSADATPASYLRGYARERAAVSRASVGRTQRDTHPMVVTATAASATPTVIQRRVEQLEAALEDETRRRRDAELRVGELISEKRDLTGSRSRVADLKAQLEAQTTMCHEMSAKQRAAEQRVAELLDDGEVKLLQGKVSGLEKLARDRAAETSDTKLLLHETQEHIRGLQEALQQQTGRSEALDLELGAVAAREEQKNREIANLRSQLGAMEESYSRQLEKNSELDAVNQETDRKKERDTAQLRDEVLTKTRQLLDCEERVINLQNQCLELTGQLQATQQELGRKNEELDKLKYRQEESATAEEKRKSRLSELETLLEAQKSDTAREMHRFEELTRELGEAVMQKDTLVRDLEKRLEKKECVEERLGVLQASLERCEHDLEAETTRHRASKRRVEELEARAANVALMQNKIRDTELSVQQQAEIVAALQHQLSATEQKVQEEKRETEEEHTRHLATIRNLQKLEEEKLKLGEEVHILKVDNSRKNVLEGQVKGLEAVVTAKEAELKRALQQLQQAEERLLTADERKSLEYLQDENHHLADTVKSLQERLQVSEETEAVQRKAAGQLQADTEQLSMMLDEKTEKLLEAEGAIDALRAELNDKAHYVDAMADLEQQLRAKEEEYEAATQEVKQLQQESGLLQNKMSEAETTLSLKQGRIDELLEQLGEQTVHADSLTVRFQKAQKEAERTGEVAENARSQLVSVSREASSLKTRLQEAEEALSEQAEALRLHKSTAREQTEILDSLRSELRIEKERTANLAARVSQLLDTESKMLQLQGKLEETERTCAKKVLHLNEREQECVDLRLKAKHAELATGRTNQLQDYNAELKSQLAHTRKQTDELLGEQCSLKEIITHLEKAVNQKSGEIASKGQVIDEKNKAVEDLEVRCKLLEGRIDEFLESEGTAQGLEAQLRSKVEQLDSMVSQNKALQTKAQQLELLLSERASDDGLAALQEKLRHKVETVQHLQHEAELQRRTRIDLHTDLEKQEKRVRLLEEELQKSVQSCHTLELRLRTAETEHDTSTRRVEDSLKMESERRSRFEVENQELEEQVRHLTSQLDYFREKCNGLEHEGEKKRQAVARMEEERGKATVEWNDLCDQLREERDGSAGVQKALTRLRNETEELRQELRQQKARGASVESRLQAEVRLKDQQIEAGNNVLATLRDALQKQGGDQVSKLGRLLARKEDECRKLRSAPVPTAAGEHDPGTSPDRVVQKLEAEVAALREQNGSLNKELRTIRADQSARRASGRTASPVEEVNAGDTQTKCYVSPQPS